MTHVEPTLWMTIVNLVIKCFVIPDNNMSSSVFAPPLPQTFCCRSFFSPKHVETDVQLSSSFFSISVMLYRQRNCHKDLRLIDDHHLLCIIKTTSFRIPSSCPTLSHLKSPSHQFPHLFQNTSARLTNWPNMAPINDGLKMMVDQDLMKFGIQVLCGLFIRACFSESELMCGSFINRCNSIEETEILRRTLCIFLWAVSPTTTRDERLRTVTACCCVGSQAVLTQCPLPHFP